MSDEKPFEPTASRLQKAKREGDVARSPEIGATAAFACGLGTTVLVVPAIGAHAREMVSGAFVMRNEIPQLVSILALMLIPCTASAIGACLATWMQGGLQFVPLQIKIERLNPAENLKRMLSRESMVGAVRGIVAFCCAMLAILPVIRAICGSALHSGAVLAAAADAWSGALQTAAAACVTGGGFAIADYGIQNARWKRRLRMSHDELKRDQKEHDGDPHARGRRRNLHRQISRGSLHRVKDAAFVVANPTHIAIALEYGPPEIPVPRVLVRAADETAARVRALAAVHAVPVVENVALARTLYATAQTGDFIPQETYIAVAEIVAALQRLRGSFER